jgi:hypothetical protein
MGSAGGSIVNFTCSLRLIVVDCIRSVLIFFRSEYLLIVNVLADDDSYI